MIFFHTGGHHGKTLLDEQQHSSMTHAAFARSRGIDGRSLNAWRINLDRSKPKVEVPQFLELVATKPGVRSCLTVRCGQFAVDVPAQFDKDALARLLLVVATC